MQLQNNTVNGAMLITINGVNMTVIVNSSMDNLSFDLSV